MRGQQVFERESFGVEPHQQGAEAGEAEEQPARPLRLEVEHISLDGRRNIAVFSDALARLAAHEIDHLYGRLYLARMRAGVEPIGVDEYHGTGRPWTYAPGPPRRSR